MRKFVYYGSFASYEFLLDAYPNAWHAFALNKLRSTYTGACLRVRRSSDNTELDIGFASNNFLDTSALLTFVGSGNGFVSTWYDQSGNGRDVTQTSAANQPRIANAGLIETNGSKNAIRFIRTSNTFLDRLSETSFSINNGYTISIFSAPSGAQQIAYGLSATSRWYVPISSSGGDTFYGYAGAAFALLSEASDNILRIYELNANPLTNVEAFTNGVSKGTITITTGSSDQISIGTTSRTSGNMHNGNTIAAITWNSSQHANRTNILSIVNSYYGIF
jgi:hypothetical protein